MQTRTRTRARTDRFTLRGWTYPYHQLADGSALARLDPMTDQIQYWLMHSNLRVEIRPGDVQDITKQVLRLDLPPNPYVDATPAPTPVPAPAEPEATTESEPAAESEAQPEPAKPAPVSEPAPSPEPEQGEQPKSLIGKRGAATPETLHVDIQEPPPASDAGSSDLPPDRSDAGGLAEIASGATLIPTGQPIGSDVVPPVAPKPDYSNWTDGYVKPEATLSDAETDALKARVKELEDALAARDAAVAVAEPAPATDDTQIPEELLAVMQANPDEGPIEYRGRLQGLLHRFAIEDGKHFPGGGEPLTADEKILIGRLLQVGAKSKQWAGL